LKDTVTSASSSSILLDDGSSLSESALCEPAQVVAEAAEGVVCGGLVQVGATGKAVAVHGTAWVGYDAEWKERVHVGKAGRAATVQGVAGVGVAAPGGELPRVSEEGTAVGVQVAAKVGDVAGGGVLVQVGVAGKAVMVQGAARADLVAEGESWKPRAVRASWSLHWGPLKHTVRPKAASSRR